MKIKIWPDDASMLQMNDWLAELRDDGRAELPGDGGETSVSDGTRPEAPAERAALRSAPRPPIRLRPPRGCARRSGSPPIRLRPPQVRPPQAAPAESAAPAERLRPPRAPRPPRLLCGL